MTLRVVGAGLPRTGTTSLKQAIETLTGGVCYHMTEVFPRFETHVPLWQRALDGGLDAFDEIFAEFSSALDWPSSMFWRELAARSPDALVILSRRRDADTWWTSVDRTVWEAMRRRTGIEHWDSMVDELTRRLGVSDLTDSSMAIAAYEAHNQAVRQEVAPDRLLEWQPSDGWEPLCAALGTDVPDEPFPHSNVTAEFRAQAGFE